MTLKQGLSIISENSRQLGEDLNGGTKADVAAIFLRPQGQPEEPVNSILVLGEIMA